MDRTRRHNPAAHCVRGAAAGTRRPPARTGAAGALYLDARVESSGHSTSADAGAIHTIGLSTTGFHTTGF